MEFEPNDSKYGDRSINPFKSVGDMLQDRMREVSNMCGNLLLIGHILQDETVTADIKLKRISNIYNKLEEGLRLYGTSFGS